jgi:hypothetical protein
MTLQALLDKLAKAHDTACYRYEMVGRKPMQRNILAARKAELTFQTLLQQARTRVNSSATATEA